MYEGKLLLYRGQLYHIDARHLILYCKWWKKRLNSPQKSETVQNTMKKTEQLQIRLEPKLKAKAEAVLSQFGLKPTEFVRMAMRQLVMRRGLPYDAHLRIFLLSCTLAEMRRMPWHC